MPHPDQDPRHRNKTFADTSASAYTRSYAASLREGLEQVDGAAIDAAYQLLREVLAHDGYVLVAGNGGSAAISDHLLCDWMKGTRSNTGPVLRVRSLVSDLALNSAIANDFGYEQVFAAQLDMLARPGDLVVLISSSGNSANIVAAAEKAKAMGLKVLGFTGFNGGKLSEMADVNLHVPAHNYGLVEDTHQALMHSLAQFLAVERDREAKPDQP